MSGTSLDGIDAVVVDFNHSGQATLIASECYDYPSSLRDDLNNLITLGADRDSVMQQQVERHLEQRYSDAALALLKRHRIEPATISAIANHGQTILST